MKCKECVNNNNGTCRTMREKPKDSWCFVTLEQALDIEKACRNYAIKRDLDNFAKHNRVYRKNIKRLENGCR